MIDQPRSRTDQPNLRLAFGVGLIACLVLAALRSISQLGYGMAPADVRRQLLPLTLPIALFWAPASLLMVWVWNAPRSRSWSLVRRLIAAMIVVLAEPAWVAVVARGHAPVYSYPTWFLLRVEANLVFCAAIGSALWAAAHFGREVRARLSLARNEAEAAEGELHVLTMQLQPHFLFNTLNLISQLAFDDIGAALRTLAHLKELLTRSLRHASRHGVPLRDELQIASAFLDIQHERFHERLRIAVSSTEDVLDAAVPPLILQPLVENAIRHGIGTREEGGIVEIVAVRKGDRIAIRVMDDGDGTRGRGHREGVGLANTRIRLDQFFAGDFSLDLVSHCAGGTTVTVEFPFHPHRGSDAADDDRRSQPRAIVAGEMNLSTDARLWSAPPMVQVMIGWLIVALIWTRLDAFQIAGQFEPRFVRWLPLFLNNVLNVLAWIAVTPVAMLAARRLVAVGRSQVRRAGEQIALTCIGAGGHFALWELALRVSAPVEYDRVRGVVATMLTLELAVYAVMLMFCVALTLARRRHELGVALLRSETRLNQARIAALRVRLQPSVLFGGLDAIARRARQSPRDCEFAISRMADLLRDVLANAERASVALGEEIQTLAAYADVTGWRSPLEISYAGDEPRRAAVPALLLTALAAASNAELTSVSAARENDVLVIRLVSRRDSISAGVVDRAELALIRTSLQALFDRRYQLESRATPAESQIVLKLPYVQLAADEDDESCPASPVRFSVA